MRRSAPLYCCKRGPRGRQRVRKAPKTLLIFFCSSSARYVADAHPVGSNNYDFEAKPHLKVLVVDEQDEYFADLKDWADMCSHQMQLDCRHIQRGQEAFGMLGEWEPDVVLVDIHLPDVPGFDVMSRCCSRAIPVVATGASDNSEMSAEAMRHGASAYLAKISDPDQMDQVLRTIVSAARNATRAM